MLTSRFSKEFDNDFESILRQVNLEALSRPIPIKLSENETFGVNKDEVLMYGRKAWSDRLCEA